MFALESPVLNVAIDAVSKVEGEDALCGLLHVFSKCKESLQDGPRLENMCWRLWHQERRAHALREFLPLSPTFPDYDPSVSEAWSDSSSCSSLDSDGSSVDKRTLNVRPPPATSPNLLALGRSRFATRPDPITDTSPGTVTSASPPTERQSNHQHHHHHHLDHSRAHRPHRTEAFLSKPADASSHAPDSEDAPEALKRNDTSSSMHTNRSRPTDSSASERRPSLASRRSHSIRTQPAGKTIAELIPDKLHVPAHPHGPALDRDRASMISISSHLWKENEHPNAATPATPPQSCTVVAPPPPRPHLPNPELFIVTPTPHPTPPMTPHVSSAMAGGSPPGALPLGPPLGTLKKADRLQVPQFITGASTAVRRSESPSQHQSSSVSSTVPEPGSPSSLRSLSSRPTTPQVSVHPIAPKLHPPENIPPINTKPTEPKFFLGGGDQGSISPDTNSTSPSANGSTSGSSLPMAAGVRSFAFRGSPLAQSTALPDDVAVAKGTDPGCAAASQTVHNTADPAVHSGNINASAARTESAKSGEVDAPAQPIQSPDMATSPASTSTRSRRSVGSRSSRTKSAKIASSKGKARESSSQIVELLPQKRKNSNDSSTTKAEIAKEKSRERAGPRFVVGGGRPGVRRSHTHAAHRQLGHRGAPAALTLRQLKAGLTNMNSGNNLVGMVDKITHIHEPEEEPTTARPKSLGKSSRSASQSQLASSSMAAGRRVASPKSQPKHVQIQPVADVHSSSGYETTDVTDDDDEEHSSDESDNGEAQAQRDRELEAERLALERQLQRRHSEDPHTSHRPQPPQVEQPRDPRAAVQQRQLPRNPQLPLRNFLPRGQRSEPHHLVDAALEAQRQRELFTKVDRTSYTNLQRTESGLSLLFHPDPKRFPENHPYRNSQSTADILAAPLPVQRPAQGSALYQQPGASARPNLPLMKPSVAAPIANTTVAVGTSVKADAPGSNTSSNGPRSRSSLRLKGRPEGELEESDSEDEEDPENAIQMASSLAVRKLQALGQKADAKKRGQETALAPAAAPQQAQDQQRRSASSSGRAPTASTINGQQTQQHLLNGRNNGAGQLTHVATAPINLNLGYPYNLPAPQPPSSPRSTRRRMLSNELSESLRRNLLWERTVSKQRPLGAVPRRTQPQQQQQPLGHGGQQGSGSRARDDSEGPTTPENLEERRKKAIARNKSWANDYHGAGW